MRRKIYIIHSREDGGSTSATRRSLEVSGVRCLSAEPPNSREKAAGKKVIEDSDVVILMLSAAAYNSMRVKRELEWAVKANKVIIPFRIDSAPLPKYFEFYLSTAHWLDASTPPLDQHLEKLVSTTRRLVGLEEGYASSSIFWRSKRPAKKAVAAAVSGVLSMIVFGVVLGLLGIVLGKVELRAIAAGRSSAAGRRYARVGVVCGYIGAVAGAALCFLLLYYDVDPTEGWRELLQPSLTLGPPGLG
jgi:hypothetical protein